ncbi:MAG: hypothetical protein L0207_04975 [Chlamydiae bacterium]|nr:hypothetical protein [Chlamydiota bacterium]
MAIHAAPLSLQEQDFLHELDVLKGYNPKNHIIHLKDGQLTRVSKTTHGLYQNFLETKVGVSERLLLVLNLSCEAIDSVPKKTYTAYYKGICKLLENWDPKIWEHLSENNWEFLNKNQNEYLLQLIQVRDLFSEKAGIDNNN